MSMTAVRFRDQYDGEGMLEHFRADLVLPYVDVLRELNPLHPTWSSGVDRAPRLGE
jgi:hypothetical protein